MMQKIISGLVCYGDSAAGWGKEKKNASDRKIVQPAVSQ